MGSDTAASGHEKPSERNTTARPAYAHGMGPEGVVSPYALASRSLSSRSWNRGSSRTGSKCGIQPLESLIVVAQSGVDEGQREKIELSRIALQLLGEATSLTRGRSRPRSDRAGL